MSERRLKKSPTKLPNRNCKLWSLPLFTPLIMAVCTQARTASHAICSRASNYRNAPKSKRHNAPKSVGKASELRQRCIGGALEVRREASKFVRSARGRTRW
eukprot:5933031-Pleurochrysis_carterae.AAC.1